jgi:hypothetical protein
MSDPVKNEMSSRMSVRRKRGQRVVEPESRVERPATVAAFVASPTSITSVLAKHGVPLETTLEWGHGGEAGPSTTKSATAAAPVFIVGAGREFLGELLHGRAALHVGFHGDALAGMIQTVQSNWGRLAREGFPDQYWYKKVGDEFTADRAAEAGGRRSVEVVDTGVVPVETLDRLFPRCVVINVVGGWLQGGQRPTRRPVTLSAGRYLEIRIADVKANPGLVARQVLEFLGEAPSVAAGEVA